MLVSFRLPFLKLVQNQLQQMDYLIIDVDSNIGSNFCPKLQETEIRIAPSLIKATFIVLTAV